MSDHIKIVATEGTYSIRAAGAVLGESANVLSLHEGDLDPVLYVPRADLAMAFFDKTKHTSFCPCLLYTSPSPRDLSTSRMPSSA